MKQKQIYKQQVFGKKKLFLRNSSQGLFHLVNTQHLLYIE